MRTPTVKARMARIQLKEKLTKATFIRMKMGIELTWLSLATSKTWPNWQSLKIWKASIRTWPTT